MNGPPPSILTFLSNLPLHDRGTKVRFLGCVQNYSPQTGTLLLAHDFPPPTTTSTAPPRAAVDVRSLTPLLDHEMTRVGEWVNVIGYVTSTSSSSGNNSCSGSDNADHAGGEGEGEGVGVVVRVGVEAVAVWKAGVLDLGEYERSLVEQGERGLRKEEERLEGRDG